MTKGNAERLFNHQSFIIRSSNKKRPWSMIGPGATLPVY